MLVCSQCQFRVAVVRCHGFNFGSCGEFLLSAASGNITLAPSGIAPVSRAAVLRLKIIVVLGAGRIGSPLRTYF